MLLVIAFALAAPGEEGFAKELGHAFVDRVKEAPFDYALDQAKEAKQRRDERSTAYRRCRMRQAVYRMANKPDLVPRCVAPAW